MNDSSALRSFFRRTEGEMSQARMVDSECVEICQRTKDGMFRFIQIPIVKQLILYALARACLLNNVRVVSVVFMSNHMHLIATGGTPKQYEKFTQAFHSIVARGMNRLQDIPGQFWCNEQPQLTPIKGAYVYARIAYLLMNPVRAFLARRWQDHAGVILGPADLSRIIRVKRPDAALGDATDLPLELILPMAAPLAQLGGISESEYIAICEQIIEEEQERPLTVEQRPGQGFKEALTLPARR